MTIPLRSPLVANLITSSGDLTSVSWTKAGSTVSANAGANPLNGVNDAFALVEDTSTGAVHDISQTVGGTSLSGVQVTLSVYVKAVGRTFIALGGSGGASAGWFDVGSGVLGTQSGGSGQIVSAGGGWYHVSFTYTGSGGVPNVIVFYCSNGNGSVVYNGNGASALLVFQPQLSLS